MRQERNRRQGRPVTQKKSADTKSRKQLRKEKKVAKKQRRRQFYQHKKYPQQQQNISKKNIKESSINIKKVVKKQQIFKQNKQKVVKKQMKESEEDKMIRMYEQKLGFKQKNKNYNKIAKKFGFDDDLFNFLDGITQKVNSNDHVYQKKAKNAKFNEDQEQIIEQDEADFQLQNHQQQMQQELQEIQGQQEQQLEFDAQNQDFDQEYDKMFDNLDQIDQNQDFFEEQENPQEIQQELQQKKIKQVSEKPKYKPPFAKSQTSPDQQSIKRSMNGLFNKLSDGNILLTFRQLMKLFESYPRSVAIPIFSDVYTRFNLLTEKPLFHILATNVALLAALHYSLGNRLLAPVLYSLTQKYMQLDSQQDDHMEVSELGYSKRFEKMKNYVTIVSLLYNYGSLSGQYIASFVRQLITNLNKNNIELLYLLIQKCGMKVRQNDPSILKQIIKEIKQSIDKFKNQKSPHQDELQKINFIELQLNQIKFNKKSQLALDQRMAFLETFINKTVPTQIQKEKEILPLDFRQILKANIQKTNWWLAQNEINAENINKDDQQHIQIGEIGKQKQKLLDLAKSFQIVTQSKRNVFICLMDSKDYLQATQRILQLKLRNMQDAASVLVQICTLEPTFNPYYALVASKMASLMPKFRQNIQYAIWDHLKLISQYDLRRTANLAKFTAKIISDPVGNCSLSILKFYPDLSNTGTIDTTFLNMFFTHFFKKVKTGYLSKLVDKLRQANNSGIKLGIQEFLEDFQPEQNVKDKVKICKRLLKIELDQRKLEQQGDIQ